MHDPQMTTTRLMIGKALKCERHATRFLPVPDSGAMEYKRMEDPSAARPELDLELLDVIRVPPCVQLPFLPLRPSQPASPLVKST